jgi:histidinol-phosphate aminotransferase/imidazoleglycerol-phosphate dehydratase/histidinol-phosphatase
LYGAPADHVLVTRGSDEAIDLLVRVFCRPSEDSVVVCPPTFGYYRVAAEIQGARLQTVPLREGFVLDPDRLVEVSASPEASAKLVFLCSPNNPTGGAIDPELIVEIAGKLPNQIVIVDEAYIEFSSTESLASRVAEVGNLVVLRTLSKAFGLAGARLGTALASPEILELMGRALAPYPIPATTLSSVLAALTPHGIAVVRERVARLARARDELASALSASSDVRRVHPSDANFLLLDVANGAEFAKRLRANGILVRVFDGELSSFVRVSVGSPEDNALLLRALGVERASASPERRAVVARDTNETNISASVDLDGDGVIDISTGVGFFDHMLEQVARHGGFGLRLTCAGDLDVDAHHTVEDSTLVLGQALREALGDKRGIARYGFVLPMDEARAEVLVDLSGRPASVFEGAFPDARVGELATEMVPHIFESLAQSLGAAIHVRVSGRNTHHMVESCFKGLGRSLRQAIHRSGSDVPSTKGVL